eukprot:GFUD01015537.1.p1 GENE.GFUD01015537.1~~GFUD01015537.1.p1  ORF type:complete len:492 (+),score=81.86 GFUD01015537.1:246-1721(+)
MFKDLTTVTTHLPKQAALFLALISILISLSSGLSSAGYHRRFEGAQSDKEILDIILHRNRYDKRIKPPLQPINVNVSVVLLSLSSPDESSLHYEVEFLMHQKWIDPRLAHSHEDGVRHLYGLSHHTQIWKPDIYLIKHGTFKSISPTEVSLKLFQNGTVFYTMRRHLVLNCEGDLPIFPFDSPMCSFNIESVSNTRDQMSFHWVGPNAVDEDGAAGSMGLSPVLKNHNAYLIHNETLYCDQGEEWRGDFSCLQVRLHFTRDKWFYYTTVFVPGLILVTSSFVTFWIEWNAEPARVMLGVTTMLNFFTTSNKFRSKLPVVSNLTAMNMWDGTCMFFIYASFLEFILVNYLARWVQDPEQQKNKQENAILDSLRVVTNTLDMKELGGHLHTLGGNIEHRLKDVNQQLHHEKKLDQHVLSQEFTHATPSIPSNHSTPTTDEEASNNGGYTLHNVKKIDNYSRRIFPTTYILFVLYFFIRYHAIEGALSIDYHYY